MQNKKYGIGRNIFAGTVFGLMVLVLFCLKPLRPLKKKLETFLIWALRPVVEKITFRF